jgi:hypothetical protein
MSASKPVFAPRLQCTLPKLPQPITAFAFLPTPRIAVGTNKSISGSNVFDVAAIVRGINRIAAPEGSSSAADSTPKNKRGGRASALFTPAARQGGVNLLEEANKDTMANSLAMDLVKGLAAMQTAPSSKSISPKSPPLIGTLASGCYFIFDTHARTFITQGLVEDVPRHSPFVPLPFPYAKLNLISLSRNQNQAQQPARLPQKERVTSITVSHQALARRLKFSLPDSVIPAAQVEQGFLQAHVPCVPVLMQTSAFAFHLDIPVSLLCLNLVPTILRAGGNATPAAISRKRKEVGGDGANLTFSTRCADSLPLLPRPRMRLVRRFKPLLAMSYADPHPAAIAGAVRAFYTQDHINSKGIHKAEGAETQVSVPSPSLVVVEAPWLQIMSQMPDKVFQKKYGKQ